MAYLHDDGELIVLQSAFDGRTVQVGLFNDSTDQLAESDGFGAITTEPGGSNYAPQSVSSPTVSQDAGQTTVDMGSLSFQVSDASASVDQVYVRDDASGDLLFTNDLDQTYDLSSIDTLDLSNVGMELQ